ncbi:MarR family winged helix-turn-helix transcriptional regulator [Frondihabitans australicus]|uniref:DNA-binding MarR family transcriptional regulator n=1 Tax=Frondihabitans australicus TaxID=386892 RepID=A0A495IEV6_9MICO|nr:MarR family transcriptional regulator [Frondihabitans australicus]RKR74527.1 DNA-binding MarR family transcriptional regulator [Frondihabitans australicus]
MTDLDQVFTDLVRFQIDLWNGVDADLREAADTSLASIESLRVIAARDVCRVNDIADDLRITVGGASKIADRLERAGLVERRANPVDRRSSLVALTREGRATLDRAAPVYEAALARRLGDRLDGATLDHLARALRLLRTEPTREDSE